MKPLYRVQLSPSDRAQLTDLLKTGTHPARVITRAHILRKAHAAWPDHQIATTFGISGRTVVRLRQRYSREGIAAIYDRPHPGAVAKLTPKDQALIIATACSPAPEGYAVWSLRLLADKVVEYGLSTTISHEALRQVLKKTSCSLTANSTGACPR